MNTSVLDALEERSAGTILGLALAMVAAIAVIDYATGKELAFSVFYLVPVVAAAWIGRGLVAAAVAVTAGLAFPVSDLLAGGDSSAAWVPVWNFGVRSGTYLVVVVLTRALRRALEQERALARVDPLTGALNSRSFYEIAEREIARSRRTGNPLTVAYLDLDGFKEVNDRFGHSAGDDVLKEIASVLAAGTRPMDAVGRLGGDEFALLFPDADAGAATHPLERVRAAVRAMADRTGYAVSASIGAATFAQPPDDVNALLRAADQLMYEAKAAGKDCIQQRVVEEPASSDAG
jgi:diguanylate cyclase (GGDEF)-like protein